MNIKNDIRDNYRERDESWRKWSSYARIGIVFSICYTLSSVCCLLAGDYISSCILGVMSLGGLWYRKGILAKRKRFHLMWNEVIDSNKRLKRIIDEMKREGLL